MRRSVLDTGFRMSVGEPHGDTSAKLPGFQWPYFFHLYPLHVTEGRRMLRPSVEPEHRRLSFSSNTTSFQRAIATISSALTMCPAMASKLSLHFLFIPQQPFEAGTTLNLLWASWELRLQNSKLHAQVFRARVVELVFKPGLQILLNEIIIIHIILLPDEDQI